MVKIPAMQIAIKEGQFYTKALGGMAGYAIPGGILAGWMVFPALGDDARGAIGLGPAKPVPAGIKYEYEDGAFDTMPGKSLSPS